MFQSAPPARGATYTTIMRRGRLCFNPRPPRGGRHAPDRKVSIRAPRAGGDLEAARRPSGRFNPRPPRGGRQNTVHAVSIRCPPRAAVRSSTVSSFNPRPPRGGRPYTLPDNGNAGVSPRPPRGGDPMEALASNQFQSAPPARGATLGARVMSFNPRPPRGGRHVQEFRDEPYVSIRAPRAGGDTP